VLRLEVPSDLKYVSGILIALLLVIAATAVSRALYRFVEKPLEERLRSPRVSGAAACN
jgi:peptidoglycan/LPS O-acetylase OafA/YrhL